MAANAPDWCGTRSVAFDDVELHEIPPNGQGIAACMALGMLSHTGVRDLGPEDPKAIRLMIEAMKLALSDAEAYVADCDAMTETSAEHLLDPAYLKARAALIDRDCAADHGSGAPRHGGTVYLSAADASGMMVSFIQSNYGGFGSGVVVPGTGIHLQNRGFGFTLTEGHPNQVGSGKRPFHTIIPGFLMRGDAPLMSFGVMGGPMQAQGHLQMTLRTQLWGQDVQTAADAPRWRVVDGKNIACETALPESTVAALRGFDQPRGPRRCLRLWRRATGAPVEKWRLCGRLGPAQGRSGGRILTDRLLVALCEALHSASISWTAGNSGQRPPDPDLSLRAQVLALVTGSETTSRCTCSVESGANRPQWIEAALRRCSVPIVAHGRLPGLHQSTAVSRLWIVVPSAAGAPAKAFDIVA